MESIENVENGAFVVISPPSASFLLTWRAQALSQDKRGKINHQRSQLNETYAKNQNHVSQPNESTNILIRVDFL